MHKTFYRKYNGIFCACVNSAYQASHRGGGGVSGNEARREGVDTKWAFSDYSKSDNVIFKLNH